MDVHELLLTRRTVHAYQPAAPLPAGALERALEAAHAAPNHRLTVPWRFTRVGDTTRAKLADLGVAIKSAKRELDDEARAKVRHKVLDPTALVVVSQVLHADPAIREEDYAATACAIQNLTISLHAEGVSSKWTTGKVTRHPEAYELLGIDAEAERVVGWVWVGIAAETARPKPARPLSLEQVVRQVD